MTRARRIAVVLATLAVSIACDQQTKVLAQNHLRGRQTISYAGDTLRLDYSENAGAFLGLGASMTSGWRTALFTAVAGVGIALILGFALWGRDLEPAQILALALIASGGLGNLIDRIWYDGYVRDFLNLGIGPVRTGIFNVADVALMAGCALFFLVKRRERPKTA